MRRGHGLDFAQGLGLVRVGLGVGVEWIRNTEAGMQKSQEPRSQPKSPKAQEAGSKGINPLAKIRKSLGAHLANPSASPRTPRHFQSRGACSEAKVSL